MLHILRNKKTAKKVWIFLAIIIIPAFTLWGFGSSGRDKRDSAPVGKIFGRTISVSDFNKSLAATRTAAIMQFGDNLPKVEKYLNLESQAWERLVLLEEAKRRRVKVTDREVMEVIEKTPYFQKDSSFDNKTYVEVLRYAFRLQPRAFEEQLRQNLILGKLYKQVTDGVQVDETKIRQEWLHKNKELSIEYIAALYEELAGKIKPAEKDVAEYYGKNKESFREPDSINLEYIAAGSEEQSGKIQELIEKKLSLGEISQQLGLSVLETGVFNRFAPPPEIK
ncbi:MAG: SurA N-terminal domain-containing protein, partial [Candidatus Omnitrophica bacterium]|nr:SurA N-terminal domain-containing protein [Candidatus Omnitrophota bacterium]